MRSLSALVFVFIVVFRDTKCDNRGFPNQYVYPQRNDVRQTAGDQGQGFQNPGQPMNNGQLPNQGQPANGMLPNQGQPINGNQFPNQEPPMTNNPGFGGAPMSGNGPMIGGQPANGNFPTNAGQFNTPTNQPIQQPVPSVNGPNPQPPFQNPYQPPYQYPQIAPPYGLNLTPEGQQAYSLILQQLGNMLNNPTIRQELQTIMNTVGILLNDPNSLQIIQEFAKRWLMALNQLSNGANTSVVVQQLQSPSILDIFKRKGLAMVNFIKDVADAKGKAINTVFDGTPLASYARSGTNLGTSAVQGVTGVVTPFLNSPNAGTAMNTFG